MAKRFKLTMDILKNVQSHSPSSTGTNGKNDDAGNSSINNINSVNAPLTPPPQSSCTSLGQHILLSHHTPNQVLSTQYGSQFLTPPTAVEISPNYIYDEDSQNDYFKFKLKPLLPTLNIDAVSDQLRLQLPQLQLVSPIERDSSVSNISNSNSASSNNASNNLSPQSIICERRGSLIPLSISMPIPSTPILVDESPNNDNPYTPLDINYKFLCVDDNMINLRILQKIISKLYPNSEIHITTNPLQALDMIASFTYNLCFLDIEMPELSGKDLAFKVRESNQLLGLIAVTTRASIEDRVTYEELGIDLTFAKPLQYSYSHIMTSVESVLEKRGHT